MFKFGAVILVSMLALSAATKVRQCTKGQPFPLAVEVDGCSEPPCLVVKGSTVAMKVQFVGTSDGIDMLTAKVQAKALGITVPYILPHDVADVCSNLLDNATCPIDDGEDVVYKFNFYVDTIYPEIPVTIQLSLEDARNQSVACFVCDIQVTK